LASLYIELIPAGFYNKSKLSKYFSYELLNEFTKFKTQMNLKEAGAL